MGRPFGVESERRHDRQSVVRRRARTGQSPDPRAADRCPVGPCAAPPSGVQRHGAARGLSVLGGRFRPCRSPGGNPNSTSPPAPGSPTPSAPSGSTSWPPSCRRCSPPTPASSTPLPGTTTSTTSTCPGWRSRPRNGTVVHPAMEWGSITSSMEYFENADQSPLWDGPPARGHLPVQVARALIDVLRRHTATPDDCWFGIWHGHGSVVADRPTLTLPAREHWLVRGPIALAAENMAEEPSEQSANLWWPADRAWY